MGVRAGRGVGAAPTKRNRDAKRRGRQKHLCDLPYLAVAKIEAAVDAHLGTVRLRDSFQAAVRRQLDDALLLEQGHLSSLKKRMNARLDELETKEDGLLDLLDDPEWPRAKIKKKLADIERERAEIQAQLTDTASKLDEGQQFFSAALALLADPQAFSRRGGDAVKRAMTKVIFSKLHIDAEDVAGHDLADGIKGLVQAGATGTGTVLTSANAESGSILIEDGAAFDLASDADLLGMALADHGSSRTAMVELLRRYSNRPDLLGPLVNVLRRVADPAEDGHETVTTIEGRTASPGYTRTALTKEQITSIVAAYESDTTAKSLAERYDVHVNTIKRALRKRGVRKLALRT